MPSSHRFINYSALLSQDQLGLVSGPAARLYAQVWNRLAFRDCTATTFPDAELLERSNIDPVRLKAVQDELVRVGWLEIERYSDAYTRYAFPHTAVPDSQD
jgi:hypothetical protein